MTESLDHIQVKPSNRPRGRLRWSLRASMVLIAILAMGLGWIVNEARAQREAVEVIRRAGGEVYYNWQVGAPNFTGSPDAGPKAPAWLLRLLGVDYFGHPFYVFASGPKITDREIAAIGRLGRLEEVTLITPKMSGNGMNHLKVLTRLRSLRLIEGRMTDADLIGLEGLGNLKTLSLTECSIGDAGLSHLKGLTGLKHLYLDRMKVTGKGLEYLKGLEQLETLSLVATDIDDAGLVHLKGLTQMRYLHLDESPKPISDQAIRELKKTMPNAIISYSRHLGGCE